jgi:hypothetical protein
MTSNRITAGGRGSVENVMKNDIQAAAEKLASDPGLTDYDFWRTLKNLEYEIFQRVNSKQPIPIDMLRWRRILGRARRRRIGREG